MQGFLNKLRGKLFIQNLTIYMIRATNDNSGLCYCYYDVEQYREKSIRGIDVSGSILLVFNKLRNGWVKGFIRGKQLCDSIRYLSTPTYCGCVVWFINV